jgi:GNAT superfamily N-acetyltransferase
MAEERRIVELGVGDVALVEGLWKEMVGHHRDVIGRASPVREADAAWRMRRGQYVAWMEAGEGRLFLVPGEGALEAPLGYAFLRVGGPPATLDLGERVGDLESLSVTAAARGMGIGTQLIGHCRGLLREEGVGWWNVTAVAGNDGAVALYEREGFRFNSHNMLGRIQ